jgi:Mn2+/Fe2+ NRAMP family transporter
VAGALITVLLVLGSFARIALAFGLLCAALLSYLAEVVLVTHQLASVLSHAPHPPGGELSKAYLALQVAVLGTTISPYLFFWQHAHRLEEMRDELEGCAQVRSLKRQSPKWRKQSTSRLDVFTGMTFTDLVMFAIIVATARTLDALGWPLCQRAVRGRLHRQRAAGHPPCSPEPAESAWRGSSARNGVRGLPSKPSSSTVSSPSVAQP